MEKNNASISEDRNDSEGGNPTMHKNPAMSVQEGRDSLSTLNFDEIEQLLSSNQTQDQLSEEDKVTRAEFLKSSVPLASAPADTRRLLTATDITSVLLRDLNAGVKKVRTTAPWITLTEINRGDFNKALRRMGKNEEIALEEELAKMYKHCLPASELNILDEQIKKKKNKKKKIYWMNLTACTMETPTWARGHSYSNPNLDTPMRHLIS